MPPDQEVAKAVRNAGLVYTTDTAPGIVRLRHGKGFTYRTASGETINDKETRERIKLLVLPPAYENVWICPLPNGHLQATGYDARGRKQYRYHAAWTELRANEKFEKMVAFGKALPSLRKQLDADLRKHGLPREKVLATVVALLEQTLIRIGNHEYAKSNESYGLTTMLENHALVRGSTLRFSFTGKSGKEHAVTMRDRRLAPIVRRIQELPGQHLFQYLGDDDETHHISSADVNAYIQSLIGDEFSAKDFRTWAATLSAYAAFLECEECTSVTELKRTVAGVVRQVADRLGNTPSVCRQSYIHAKLLECAGTGLPIQKSGGRDVEKSLIRFLEENSFSDD